MNARDYAENAQGFLAEDDAEMALSAVVDCLMELTRPEATPPAPAVDDEPGVGAVVQDVKRLTACTCGLADGDDACEHTEAADAIRAVVTPPPAPEPREDARRPQSGDRVRGYGHTHVKPEERLPDGTEGIYRRRSTAGDGALWVEVGGQWRHFTRVEPDEPREDAAANSKPAPSSAKTWRNEREATPPEPAPVRDEPEIGAVSDETLRQFAEYIDSARKVGDAPEDAVREAVEVFSLTLVSTPTPPPAPDQPEGAVDAPDDEMIESSRHEGAVEALAQDLRDLVGGDPEGSARTILKGLRDGDYPGYGPTGDRTGEVTNRQGCSVKMQHDQHVWRGYTGTSWLCGGRQTSDTL